LLSLEKDLRALQASGRSARRKMICVCFAFCCKTFVCQVWKPRQCALLVEEALLQCEMRTRRSASCSEDSSVVERFMLLKTLRVIAARILLESKFLHSCAVRFDLKENREMGSKRCFFLKKTRPSPL
jgi:hypothetical protein